MKNTIQSPNFTVNAATILKNSDAVVEMIRKHLKVGCKKTHALDIASAAFIKDYQTLKGLADKDYYQLKANIGSYEAPIKVSEDLGFFDSEAEAISKAKETLKNCLLQIEWYVTKNGKRIERILSTASKSDNCLTATIEVTGRTTEDLSESLSYVASQISSGSNSGGDSLERDMSYSYEVFGNEYELPLNSSGKDNFAIVDETGWLLECNDLETAEASFDDAGNFSSSIERWSGDLKMLVLIEDHSNSITVEGDEVENDDDCVILDEDGKEYSAMTFEDIIQELESEDVADVPSELVLYKVVSTKH